MFAVRVDLEKPFDLRDCIRCSLRVHEGLSVGFLRNLPPLVEPSRIGLSEGCICCVEIRRAAPQDECFFREVECPSGVRRCCGVRDEAIERVSVHRVSIDRKQISGSRGLYQFLLSQGFAQLRDVVADSARGVRGRQLFPHPVDDGIEGDQMARIDDQSQQQSAL